MRQGMVRAGLSGSVFRAAAVGVLAAGLVAGCSSTGDDPAPTVEPTTAPTSPEPEPEPEPTEELPEEPEAPLPPTGTPDETDAEAAGEFFLELYEYTVATGDAQQWQERSHPDCGFCTSVLESADQDRDAGTRVVGVDVTHGEAQFVAFDEALRMFAVEVPYHEAATTVVDADGEVIAQNSAGEGYLLLELGYLPSSGWELRTGGHYDESVR